MMKTRRDFIKSLVVAGGVQALSGCSTLDQIFMGESSDLTSSVVIIGGGLAGLVCAYELKKRGIPYTLFEQGENLGGQILTSSNPFGGDSWVDWGAEFFTPYDQALVSLVKELELEVFVFPSVSQKKTETSLKYLRSLQALWFKKYRVPSSSDILKSQSLAEWGWDLNRDSQWLKQLEYWSWYRCGVSSENLTPGIFIKEFQGQGQTPWSTAEWSLPGGLGRLTQTLAHHVFGLFSEQKLKLEHELIRVESSGRDVWDFVFQTPMGRRRYMVKQVILTPLPHLLAPIEGFSDFVVLPDAFYKTASLVTKWARLQPWQKPYRSWGLEPRWGRGYQKRGAWDQIKAQSFVELGLYESQEQLHTLQSSFHYKSQDVKGDRKEDFFILTKNWNQQKGVLGRSTGAKPLSLQPRWNLPPFWLSTQDLGPHTELYSLSSLNLAVTQAQLLVSRIARGLKTDY
jgi:hypothetical protein